MDIADYRRRAEAYTIELGGAHHRHFAGHDASLRIEPIQTRYAALFGKAAIDTLRERVDAATGSADRGRARALLAFAVEGHLARATRALDAETERREAAARLDNTLPYRGAQQLQADEPDCDRRAAIEAARLRVVAEQLAPVRREAVGLTHACARDLGWPSYRAMCETLTGIDYGALELQATRLLATTTAALERALAVAAPWSVGVARDAMTRSDLPRFFRCAPADRWYAPGALPEALERTLAQLGIELARQANVHVDTERRARKSPRAFCAPVRVPDEIHLVIAPLGGRDDYVALLHEAGHAQHYAWTDPSLPFESRRLGDSSVTEAFAFLFDALADDHRWLARNTAAPAIDVNLDTFAIAARLLYVRRYCAKLTFELELHSGGSSPERYAHLLTRAMGVAWPAELSLTDLDPLLYSAGYLRAWALAAQLTAMLRERFGPDWFEQPPAGALLRSLWREGQRFGAEELAAYACDGAALDFEPLLAELGGLGAAPAAVSG